MAKDQFRGRTAIVTGASSGIGEGIARKFASLGVNVTLTSRRETELNRVAAEIKREGGQVLVVSGDSTREEVVTTAVDRTVQEFGGVDIMVNCAGVGEPAHFENMSEGTVRQHMELHYFAATRYCREVIPLMKKQGSGYIVNMGSVSALIGLPRWTSYGASKAAVLRFSDALRREVNKYGIQISVLCPSLVSTDLLHDHWEDYGPWAGKFKILEVEPVVDCLIKGMKKKRFIILDTFNVKLMYALYRYFPRVFRGLFMWAYKID